jgi:hypothetical protein
MVAGFGRAQVMADRADPADARRNLGHFEMGTALTEFLETSPLVDMEVGPLDAALVIDMNGHFGMAFDSGYGFNGDFLHGVNLE